VTSVRALTAWNGTPMIETLKSLAWTPAPKPPLGVVHWQRRTRWFRWYIVYPIIYKVWQVRTWLWHRRTGGKQSWCW
jgi:hypothetical protein